MPGDLRLFISVLDGNPVAVLYRWESAGKTRADRRLALASIHVGGHAGAVAPDLVVLAIGENVLPLGSDDAKAQFNAGVLNILRCVLAKRHPLVVVRSCFWPDAAWDQMLREASEEAQARFVDAGPRGQDPANAASSERSFAHAGVAGHPSDRGMQTLADAIVAAILDER